MRLSRTISVGLVLAFASLAHAQGWSDAYGRALTALRAENWTEARKFFREAASLRAEDQSEATMMRGSVTEPRSWRNGASYSPNFGAAYSGYRESLKFDNEDDRTKLLSTVAAEFQALLAKNQNSREAFYFLGNTYALLRDNDKRKALESQFVAVADKLTWKVDQEILTLEERAEVYGNAPAVTPNPEGTPEPKVIDKPEEAKPTEKPVEPPSEEAKPAETKPAESKPAQTKRTNPVAEPAPRRNPTSDGPAPRSKPRPKDKLKPNEVRAGDKPVPAGPVAALNTKYALIIGNSESRIPGAAPTFAANSADYLKGQLMTHAGYPEANISVVKNATSQAIMEAAKALAARMSEGGTVLIYFAGVGANLDGKDYLAGTDTSSATDSSAMVEKVSVFQQFMSRGARIFSFFEVNRPMSNDRYFGQEVPMVGMISQMQSCRPGDNVQSILRDGKEIGLFTNALGLSLAEFSSNRVPIYEFGWQVYNMIRGSDTGTARGGATQVPTLPVFTNMSQDARF
jgi:hypothetical protein